MSKFQSIFNELSNQLEDAGLLKQIEGLINDVKPKLEIAVYLSNSCFKMSHWQWLSENVLRYHGLGLKFAGQHSEIVMLMDLNVGQGQGQEPVGLGELHRYQLSDLIYR